LAKKIKVDKRKIWKESDELVSKSTEIFNYIQDNQRRIIISVCAVLVAVVLFMGWRFYSYKVERTASSLYCQAIRNYNRDDYTKSSAKEDEERCNLAFTELQDLIKKYPHTSIAPLALLYSGHIKYKLKEFDESIGFYKGFLEKTSSGNPLRLFALDGLGYAYVAKGDYKNALPYFKKLIDGNKNTLTRSGYFNVSRCYEELGEKETAIETLRNIITNYPNSGYATLAKEKINILNR